MLGNRKSPKVDGFSQKFYRMGFFLELSIRPLEFGPASNANAVFFDETNSEVISVHNESEILINSQNYLRNDRKVKLKPHGPIFAIKSSISNSILVKG